MEKKYASFINPKVGDMDLLYSNDTKKDSTKKDDSSSDSDDNANKPS